MMLDGVRIRIDSGTCFTIFPEIAANVPLFNVPSNLPMWVVLSKLYWSIAKTLLGPVDIKLLSINVMPTAPSAPVVITSAAKTFMPGTAAIFSTAR